MNQVQNVVRVARILSSQLPELARLRTGYYDVAKDFGWTELDITVPASLSINNKVDGKGYLWEITLTFRTCENLSVYDGHHCYLAYFADGRKILIGTFDRPYPITTWIKSITENVKDNQMYEVTVKHKMAYREPLIY